MFEKWGITLGDQMVADEKSDVFPVPQNRQLGNGMVVREIHQVPYPYFVRVDGDQLSDKSVITNGMAGAVMHWATTVTAKAGTPLLTSSPKAWLTSPTDVGTPPKPEGKQAPQVLAVSVMRRLRHVADEEGRARTLAAGYPDRRVRLVGVRDR